jgi:hypothetical protein
MEIIDEKLTTGFHGIKHLFISNDPLKTGKVTKYTHFFLLYFLWFLVEPTKIKFL